MQEAAVVCPWETYALFCGARGGSRQLIASEGFWSGKCSHQWATPV